MASLGIDGGATAAKWVLLGRSDSAIINRGSSQAIDGHLYRPESLHRFRDFLFEVQNSIGSRQIETVTLGITGFGSPELISQSISEFFPDANIEVSTDIALAYHGEFGLGEGILIYAGTGSIAIHINRENQEVTTGGWGYLLGDEGGGFWIGRESLRHLARISESGEKFDELSKVIAEQIGGSQWSDIRAFTYSVERSEIARLSRLVVALAESQESTALDIVKRAAYELSSLVRKLEKRLGNSNLPVKFGGGISQSSPLFREFLEEDFGRDVQISAGDYALTAAKLGIKRWETSSRD